MYILPLAGAVVFKSFAEAVLAVFEEYVILLKFTPVEPVNPADIEPDVGVPIVP